MKKIISFILLLGVLCLAGCKEDSVLSFSFNEKEVGEGGSSFTVDVLAEVPWSVKCIEGNAIVNTSEGTGPGSVLVNIPKNNNLTPIEHILLLTSSDGKHSDRLVINQKERLGLEILKADTISCDGGHYELACATNDEITSVKYPEWMTLVSSRGVKNNYYTFEVEPNKTGKVRRGEFTFVGKNKTSTIHINQDSYAPKGLNLTNFPEAVPIVFESNTSEVDLIRIPLTPIPEYAGLEHVSVTCEWPEICKCYMDGTDLCLQFTSSAAYKGIEMDLVFYNNGKRIETTSILPVFGKIPSDNRYNVHTGQEFDLSTLVPSKYIGVEIPEGVPVKYLGEKTLVAEKPGEYTVYLTHLLTGQKEEVNINAHHYLASAYLSYRFDWGSVWDVEITGEIKGKNIENYTSCFVDTGRGIQVPLNKQESYGEPASDKTKNKYFFSIVAYSLDELERKISNFRFLFTGDINGEKTEIEIPVSPKKP